MNYNYIYGDKSYWRQLVEWLMGFWKGVSCEEWVTREKEEVAKAYAEKRWGVKNENHN